ncbi:MAG: PspC domain-containing protein [Chloroflexota bacterium]
MEKRLVRSEAEGQVAGVSWGLAQYFDVDVTLVRIAFVVLTLAGGPGLLAYIALWIVMPDISKDEKGKNDFTEV